MSSLGWAVWLGLSGCSAPALEVSAWTSAQWSPESPAAVRVVVRDADGAPTADVPVEVYATGERLFAGRTDIYGTVPARLTTPTVGDGVEVVVGGWLGTRVSLPVRIAPREDTWVIPLQGGTGRITAAIVQQDALTGRPVPTEVDWLDLPLGAQGLAIGEVDLPAAGLVTERQLFDDPAKGGWSEQGTAWRLEHPGVLYAETWVAGQLVDLAVGREVVSLATVPPQAVVRAWASVEGAWSLLAEAPVRAAVSGHHEGPLSAWGARPEASLAVVGPLDAGSPIQVGADGDGVAALALVRGSRSPLDPSLRLQLVRPQLAIDEVSVGRDPVASARRPAVVQPAPPSGELVLSSVSAPGETLQTPPLESGRWTLAGLWLDVGGLAVTERALDVAAPLRVDVPWGADLVVGDDVSWPLRVRTRDGGSAALGLEASGGIGEIDSGNGRRVLRWRADRAGAASAVIEARWAEETLRLEQTWVQREPDANWPLPAGGAILETLEDCRIGPYRQGSAWGVVPGEAADVLSTAQVLVAGCAGPLEEAAERWLLRQRLTDGSFAPPAGQIAPLGRREEADRTLVTAWALLALRGLPEADLALTVEWLARHAPRHREGTVARRAVLALEAVGAVVPATLHAYAELPGGRPDPGAPLQAEWSSAPGELAISWPARMQPGQPDTVVLTARTAANWPLVVVRAPVGMRWDTDGLGSNEDVRWWQEDGETLSLLMTRGSLDARLGLVATSTGRLHAPRARLVDPYSRLDIAGRSAAAIEVSAPEVPLDAGEWEAPVGWE